MMSDAEMKQADKIVGARIKAMRMAMGMSQTALGEKCGVTFQQIQKYENGANRLRVSRLIQIARVLAVDPDWFLKDYIAIHTNDNAPTATEIQRPKAERKTIGKILKGDAT